MANGAATPVDQQALDRYQDEFYRHTDLVYRFGLVLTCSRDGAERLAEETFRRLIDDFARVPTAANASEYLLGLAWQVWDSLKSERFHSWNQPTLTALKVLSAEERAAVFIVDIAGVTPRDAAQKLSMSERDLRRSLATARKRLTTGEITL